MRDYVRWLEELPGKPVFVAYPVAFDYMFVQWYLMRFVGHSPLGISALDVKTYAMAVLKSDYHGASKAHMPKAWFDDLPHSHVALDDAIGQGALFCNILRHSREVR